MQIDLTAEQFQAELAAFDDAMSAIAHRFKALPEDSPQQHVLAAEVEVRISRMQGIMDRYHELSAAEVHAHYVELWHQVEQRQSEGETQEQIATWLLELTAEPVDQGADERTQVAHVRAIVGAQKARRRLMGIKTLKEHRDGY